MRWRPSPYFLVVVACVIAGLLALITTTLPAPAPVDAAAREFSAERAVARVSALLGDERPHPVASPANQAVRGRLIAQLEELGVEPELQRSFSCSDRGVCAWVENVIVRLPGEAEVPAIALAAHYDSVSAGPGAADDLQGVGTVIECLRALLDSRARRGPSYRPLVAVFTDGEEVGLLGARAFTRHPLFTDVAVMINVEARGTEGRPQMFEASAGNHRLIGAVASSERLPMTTSLAYEIYRRMPNDTDLSVWMRGGAQGLNFAFIGGVRRYHTPRDDLAHLDHGSVQVQGAAVLSTTRALLADRQPLEPTVDAAYTDLFGALLLRWSAPTGVILAVLALLGLLGAAVRARSAGAVRLAGLAAALAVVLLTPIIAAAGGYALLWLTGALSSPLGPFPTAPGLALLAVAAAASSSTLLAIGPLARRIGAPSLALGAGLLWAGLGLATALLLPGASALLLPTALVSAIGLLIASSRRGAESYLAATLVSGAVAFAILVPHVQILADAVGLNGLMVGAAVGWMWTAALPTLAAERGDLGLRALAWGLVGLTVIGGGLSAVTPRATADQPHRLNFLHVSDLDRASSVIAIESSLAVDRLPEALTGAPWSSPSPVLPWSGRSMPTTAAATVAEAGPELEVRALTPLAEGRTIRALIRARPGAALVHVVLPELLSITIEGETVDVAGLRGVAGGAKTVTIWGPPPTGVEVVATVSGEQPWVVADALLGLPAGDRGLAEARPEELVASQWGDLSLAYRAFSP